MKYQGSKSRIASDIIPIMLEAFSKNNCEIFIDCCVGGGNLLDKIPHSIERYGNDSNEYLIEMWKAVSNGWIPPKIITEDDYYNIRDNKDDNKCDAALFEVLKKYRKGSTITFNGFNIKEGETSPPKRYNSGSIILAMENAGQLIEDEELRAQIKGSGIGTSATRAEILKKLNTIKYISII